MANQAFDYFGNLVLGQMIVYTGRWMKCKVCCKFGHFPTLLKLTFSFTMGRFSFLKEFKTHSKLGILKTSQQHYQRIFGGKKLLDTQVSNLKRYYNISNPSKDYNNQPRLDNILNLD